MKKTRLRFSLAQGWQFISTAVLVAASLSLLLLSRLDTLVPTYSKSELATAHASASLKVIANHPVDGPYKLLVYGITHILHNPLLATRLASVILGGVSIILFYLGVRQWYAKRIAFLSTVLFACSAWFLHIARHGTADIMLVFSPLLLATSAYFIASSEGRHFPKYLIAIAVLALTIYTPGMLIFVIVGLALRGKDIFALRKRLNIWQVLVVLVAFLGLVVGPLTYALLKHPSQALDLLGLPHTLPDPIEYLKTLVLLPLSIFVHSSFQPELHLAHLPYADIFTAVMFCLGVYYFFKQRTLSRSKILLSFVVLSSLLYALKAGVESAALLSVVFIIAGAGLLTLLGQWLTVFPRNPVAKTIGIVLVTTAVLISSAYNLRSYFIAWPHNSETKQSYTVTPDNF
jgi:hypothetical protein